MDFTKEQLQEDIYFLSKRQMDKGFQEKRDTGMSSNSIVAIAYGLLPLKNQYFPMDASDRDWETKYLLEVVLL